MKWVRTVWFGDEHLVPVTIMPSDHADRMLALLREVSRHDIYEPLRQQMLTLLAESDGAAKESA